MKHNNVTLSIEVNGKAIAEYEKNSAIFIEGKDGAKYSIRVKNHNEYRCKIVVGVDGISILDSKPISDDNNQTGYIIEAYGETLIKGYRIDANNVSSFKFVAKEKAYVSETNKELEGKTTGTISCRVYKEQGKLIDGADELDKMIKKWEEWKPEKEYIPVPYYPKDVLPWHKPNYEPYPWNHPVTFGCMNTSHMETNKGLNAEYAAKSQVADNQSPEQSASSFNLGSSWGQKVESVVKEVEFITGDHLGDLIIYYSDRIGLEAMGISFKKVAQVSELPNPFPADKKYCRVPSGWGQ